MLGVPGLPLILPNPAPFGSELNKNLAGNLGGFLDSRIDVVKFILTFPGALIDNILLSENAGDSEGGPKQCDDSGSQDKKLTKGETKKLIKGGVHPHDLKDNSRQDLFKDRNGNIVVKPKSGIGPGDSTGININDF